ncbi:hypothetical protein Fmac_018245 [Flemingia macrophylla]|uniref:Uncharacterized protein n=1 Tax=Flemingia macrophylla TaxID=520843 RepID=A0ABD1M4E7_9FABA
MMQEDLTLTRSDAQKWWEIAQQRTTSLSELKEKEKKGLAQMQRICEEKDRALDNMNELNAKAMARDVKETEDELHRHHNPPLSPILERGEPSSRYARKFLRAPHQQRGTMLQSHCNRVESLQNFTLHPIRSLDCKILCTMGWEDDMRYILNIGWPFLMSFHPKIYPRATMVFYWMNGAYHSTTLDDFNIQCGLISSEDIYTEEYQTAYLAKPDYLSVEDIWREIIGNPVMPTHMKGSQLNNALRVCHKLIASTIHGKHDSQGIVTQQDLFSLYYMHMGWKCNLDYFFLEHVKALGNERAWYNARGTL